MYFTQFLVNNRRVLFLSLLSIFVFSPLYVTVSYARSLYQSLYLGDSLRTAVTVRISESGYGFTYINLHESEQTSVVAGRRTMNKYGGRMFTLRHGGGRNISFALNRHKYTFDPNRIFTDKGIRDTLTELSSYSVEADAVVKGFAQELLRLFAIRGLRGGRIVTLHNNTNGAYSIASYRVGGSEARATKELFINPNKDTDDFFLVTSPSVYRALATRGYNVVLQNSRTVPDDGSLSVYAARLGIDYVNVETQLGHLYIQEQMLKVLNTL